jgi:hypothetical protein
MASLKSPAKGSVLPGSSVTFSWTAGTGVTAYQLWLGTAATGSNAQNLHSASTITTTSTTATGLPTNGSTLYARLYSFVNGTWQSANYTFTESGGSATDVVLKWDAPASSATPVSSYNVYRASSGSSSYELLTSTANTETTYTDSSAAAGETYDYMVKSVASSGATSAPSNTAAATVP